MSDRIPDELLSACFDGEITPEERARVDALLASDPQARKSLEECRKLSGYLRELATPHAPTEFSAAVMQTIERQMLLGRVDETASVPAPQPPKRTGRWASGAVLMAAAAMVLVAVFVGRFEDHRIPGEQLAGAKAVRDFDGAAAPELARNEAPLDAPARIAGTDVRSSAERSFATPAPASLPTPSARMEPGAKSRESGSTLRNDSESRLVFHDLKNVEVGQVVEAIEHNGGRVAVVRCTVLDRMDGVRGFQALLTRNSISEDLPQAVSRSLKEQDRAPNESKIEVSVPAPSGDELIGVFVEAPREQIAEVLRQIQSLELQELAVDEPVEFEQLNNQLEGEAAPESQHAAEFGDTVADKKNAGDSSRLAKDAAKDSKVVASSPATRQSSARPAEDFSPKTGMTDRALRRNLAGKSQIPRQRQLNLPSQMFELGQRGQDSVGKMGRDVPAKIRALAESGPKRPVVAARPDALAEGAAQQPGAPAERSIAASPATKVSADEKNRAPVQVLFVFVDKRSPSPAVPARPSPPAKAKARGDNAAPSRNDGAAS
ncbi:MAG: hypothetical protein AB7O26_02525 [Planctomycetaceae bacterium]